MENFEEGLDLSHGKLIHDMPSRCAMQKVLLNDRSLHYVVSVDLNSAQRPENIPVYQKVTDLEHIYQSKGGKNVA